jgi:hypothetical protein
MIEWVARPSDTDPVGHCKEAPSPPGGWEGLNRLGAPLTLGQC